MLRIYAVENVCYRDRGHIKSDAGIGLAENFSALGWRACYISSPALLVDPSLSPRHQSVRSEATPQPLENNSDS
jgi:hypothetical protein